MTPLHARLLAVTTTIAATFAVAACSVDGTPVASTIEPTTTTSSSRPPETRSTYEIPSLPSLPRRTPTVEVPPPPNSLSITCADYSELDEPTQVAIVKANGVTKNPSLVAVLVKVLCISRPDDTVNTVVNSMKDEIIHN
ncbi:hypothetical protein [Gordonia metallireducens]|uniref:hypothetical protein n=1 Tax=Gordonia metallireducens TaxID=2897779 RepID=UPI001E34E9B0|nr:hypothetical protein [Gordonia metallireducens]